MIWTAPELLNNLSSISAKGTKAGDVYSFAIVLHEIFYRMGPFSGHEDMSIKGEYFYLQGGNIFAKLKQCGAFLFGVHWSI